MVKFKDAQFMSAEDKAKVLKHWTTFINNGMQWTHFTKRIYDHLHLHCSFIAHYNQLGFYDTYFEQPDSICRFLDQFDRTQGAKSVEVGGSWWLNDADYSDLNNEMCRVVESSIENHKSRLIGEERINDLEIVYQIMKKWGLKHVDLGE